MLFVLLGWATVALIALTTVGSIYAMWLALYRPWMYRPSVPVPKLDEAPALLWIEQDNPIPWI